MQKLRQWQATLLGSRWLAAGVVGLMLTVLGATIYLARLRVRDEVRQQLAGRDAEVLYQAIQLLQEQDDSDDTVAGGIADAAAQFDLILKASRMKGVLAVRLFTPDGGFANGLPFDAKEATLTSTSLAAARQLKPSARYQPRMQFEEIFYTVETNRPPFPALEVIVPLHAPDTRTLAGIAQFLLEGHSLAAEYARLDGSLNWQAWLAFAVGGLVMAGTIGWAFRRLAERTASLQRANQQLALAARASAVGAVTAHLLHGLKNPLAGLQNFVTGRGTLNGEGNTDWEQAAASTRRMATLINEAVAVLQEERAGTRYELTLLEFSELVIGRVTGLAKDKGVLLQIRAAGDAQILNRTANLAGLILANLLQNAIQATCPGKTVQLELRCDARQLVCHVEDQGTGLPEQIRHSLFSPCCSTKPGGSGLGLAISKQLANHLGASLELKRSSMEGCCFELILPAIALAGELAALQPPSA